MTASCSDGCGTWVQMVAWEDEGLWGQPLTWQWETQWASPTLTFRGAISVGMSPIWGWGTGREGTPCSDAPKAAALVSWAVGHDTVVVGTHLNLLGGGGTTDMRGSGWVMAPCRMLYRALAFDLATANSTCWRPLVPRCPTFSHRHSVSNHRKLVLCNLHSLWKKQEEDHLPWMWPWQGQRDRELDRTNEIWDSPSSNWRTPSSIQTWAQSNPACSGVEVSGSSASSFSSSDVSSYNQRASNMKGNYGAAVQIYLNKEGTSG